MTSIVTVATEHVSGLNYISHNYTNEVVPISSVTVLHVVYKFTRPINRNSYVPTCYMYVIASLFLYNK